jgi:hypothetical protein
MRKAAALLTAFELATAVPVLPVSADEAPRAIDIDMQRELAEQDLRGLAGNQARATLGTTCGETGEHGECFCDEDQAYYDARPSRRIRKQKRPTYSGRFGWAVAPIVQSCQVDNTEVVRCTIEFGEYEGMNQIGSITVTIACVPDDHTAAEYSYLSDFEQTLDIEPHLTATGAVKSIRERYRQPDETEEIAI